MYGVHWALCVSSRVLLHKFIFCTVSKVYRRVVESGWPVGQSLLWPSIFVFRFYYYRNLFCAVVVAVERSFGAEGREARDERRVGSKKGPSEGAPRACLVRPLQLDCFFLGKVRKLHFFCAAMAMVMA